jgi:UDPglucose 6-dehydrogenase
MKVTIFGMGYVGLVQAAVLASVGHDVLCVDVDERRVENLRKGIIPLFEPGLAPLIEKNHSEGRLKFTTNAVDGVKHAPLQFIAVGTPPDESGAADLNHVLTVAATIATHMDAYKVVINKSTVPVGTADKVRESIATILKARNETFAFDVVSNPEFLKEGAAVNDCMRPDRIIVGIDNPDDTESHEIKELLRELYAPFSRNHEKIIFMDIRSSELTKYAANCMLATKISFMNEMANLAEKLGADIEMVRQGIGSDPRIGYQFIYPGCGYGGSCLPKDVKALIRTANDHDYKPSLLEAVEQVNSDQKHKLFGHVTEEFGADLTGRQFAIWGLSFKPQTDDMREASSRVLIEALWQAGAKIKAYDPEAMHECQRIYGDQENLLLMGTKEACLPESDALIICTEWSQFRAPDFEMLHAKLNRKVIIDGRNLYDPALMKKKGFTYYGIGRGASVAKS